MKISIRINQTTSVFAKKTLDIPPISCRLVTPPPVRIKLIHSWETSMLLNDDEIAERIESPLNLLNRLRTTLNRISPNPHPAKIPCLPPKAEDIISDLNEKLVNSTAKNKATSIMLAAMDELSTRISETKTPEKLADIAYNMRRIVSSEEQTRHNHSETTAQIIIYAPQVQKIEDYEIIDVTE